MKLIIKTIKGEVFHINAEPTDKISEIKQKIQEAKNIEIATQKLISRGKQTEDNQTIDELGIKDGDFMVVMVTKKPATQPTTQPQTQQAKPVQQETKPQETQPKVQPKAQPKVQATDQKEPPKHEAYVDHASSLLHGPELENTINEICSMGFERPEVIKALKAAFNNPDRAIEYLFSGIPSNLQTVTAPLGGGMADLAGQPRQEAGGSQALGGMGGMAGMGGMGGMTGLGSQGPAAGGFAGGDAGSGENPLAFLAHSPGFQQLRASIIANPALLQSLMTQLSQSNPQIYQLINENQEAFLKLIMEGSGSNAAPRGAGGMGGMGGRHVIHVTKEEKEAVDRLAALGFSKQLAIEAYLACDKNEELAANYLLERQMEEGFDVPPQTQNQGQSMGANTQANPNNNNTNNNNNQGGGNNNNAGGSNNNTFPPGKDNDDEDDNLFG